MASYLHSSETFLGCTAGKHLRNAQGTMAVEVANELSKVHLSAQERHSPSQLSIVDQRWSLSLHKRFSSSIPRWIFMNLEHSGNGVLWLLLVPLLWLYAPLSTDSRHMLANFFLGLWVDLALVGALKGTFRRPRPEYNISGDFILVVAVDKYSFPSGHAARQATASQHTISGLIDVKDCL